MTDDPRSFADAKHKWRIKQIESLKNLRFQSDMK